MSACGRIGVSAWRRNVSAYRRDGVSAWRRNVSAYRRIGVGCIGVRLEMIGTL